MGWVSFTKYQMKAKKRMSPHKMLVEAKCMLIKGYDYAGYVLMRSAKKRMKLYGLEKVSIVKKTKAN